MCMACAGWSPEQIREKFVRDIDNHGWSVCAVGPGGGHPSFAYTLGLTRYHGHPELVVSGFAATEAMTFLNDAGEQVRRGRRFTAGEVLETPTPYRVHTVAVADPRRLVMAQEIYRADGGPLVRGLQLVWTNPDGRWPWDPRWAEAHRAQEVFGRPIAPAA